METVDGSIPSVFLNVIDASLRKERYTEHISQLTISGSVIVLLRKTNDALKEIRNEEPQYNWRLSNE